MTRDKLQQVVEALEFWTPKERPHPEESTELSHIVANMKWRYARAALSLLKQELQEVGDGPSDAQMLDWLEKENPRIGKHASGFSVIEYGLSGLYKVNSGPTLRAAVRSAMEDTPCK